MFIGSEIPPACDFMWVWSGCDCRSINIFSDPVSELYFIENRTPKDVQKGIPPNDAPGICTNLILPTTST